VSAGALKRFEYLVQNDVEFPWHGGGNVVFDRDWFIHETCNMVLKKSSSRYKSYYWRAPVGSGKTVFLKVLGRELQSRGCDVYMTLARLLDRFDEGYFTKLAGEAGDKTVVLLIDEVQNDVKSFQWNALLKDVKPSNLLVLGVGVPYLEVPSPQFDCKFPSSADDAFPTFLCSKDLPEVCSYFENKYSRSSEVTTEVLERLLEFTAGHLFPFVMFAQHVLDHRNEINLINIEAYLSSEEFRSSETYNQVRERCFDFVKSKTIEKAENLLLNKGSVENKQALRKLSLWLGNRFVSPLLTTEVFLNSDIDFLIDKITLDETEKTPYAQQIILAGLRDMTEEDFKDVHFERVAVENAIGFKWAINLKSVLPNVWISPQVRTKYAEHAGRGAKPLIDFYFNGRMNLGIELALNLKFDGKSGIRSHLERFDKDYARYEKNGVVLHFDTNTSDAPDKNEARLYTFLKKRNELYRGSSLIQSNVAINLQSPPVRSYSTTIRLGTDLMRRVVNRCR
jgi:hypothetical protein